MAQAMESMIIRLETHDLQAKEILNKLSNIEDKI